MQACMSMTIGRPIVPQIDMMRSPGLTRTLRDSPSGERYCSVLRRKRLDRVTSAIRTQPTLPPKYRGSSIGRGDAPLRIRAIASMRFRSVITQLREEAVEFRRLDFSRFHHIRIPITFAPLL